MSSLIKTPSGEIKPEDVTAPLPSRTFREAWRVEGTVVTVDPEAKRAIMVPMVRAEAQRRIMALMGARDLQDCVIKQLNALKITGALNDKRARGEVLTAEEEVTAQYLRDIAATVDAIRAASNVLEATNPIPDNYADDKHWP